jgi:hypothetical protein
MSERLLSKVNCFQTDIVTHCLTDSCTECTGSYVNEDLQHRWICNCKCHAEEKALVEVGKPGTNAIKMTQPSNEVVRR